MSDRARTAGAVVAGVVAVAALGVGGLAAWTSLVLWLGEAPASDPAWGDFIGMLLAPVAVIALALGFGLAHIARRNWRRARRGPG